MKMTELNEKIERNSDRVDQLQIKALGVCLIAVVSLLGTVAYVIHEGDTIAAGLSARVAVLESEVNGIGADIEKIEETEAPDGKVLGLF